MTVVIVTQQRKVEWFVDEQHYYHEDPTLVLTFDPKANVWWGRSFHPTPRAMNRSVGWAFHRLTRNPWADVSDVATHTVPEPGAPIEPVQEVLA